MYIEDPAKVYGCYHCGEIMGEYTIADTGHYMCSRCGEPTIITLTTALDTMIKLQREGHLFASDYYDEDEADVDVDPAEELFFDSDESEAPDDET